MNLLAVFSTADATVVVALIAMIATPTVIAIRTRRDVRQINRAVNHVAPGEPTLIQRVRDIQADNHEFRLWSAQAIARIAQEVGARLDPPPAERHDGGDEGQP